MTTTLPNSMVMRRQRLSGAASACTVRRPARHAGELDALVPPAQLRPGYYVKSTYVTCVTICYTV